MNAVKHGMTARVPVLPGEDEATFRQRVEGIVDSLEPRNDIELALAEQAALSLWKIERAERAEATRVTASIRAAEARAEAHRQEELHALGRWLLAKSVQAKRETAEDLLAFLPEDRHATFRAGRGEPLVILHRIQATADGCRWLFWRWDRLLGRLEQEGGWDLEEMIEAAQLRGERPLLGETADWEGLQQERYAGNTAYLEEGRRQLLDQLIDGRAAEGAGLVAALHELVEEETARLEGLQAAHEGREAADRAELADRLAVDATPEGERVRRYQLDCDRKLHRALQGLLKLRREEGIGVADDPAPDSVPGPDAEGTVAVQSGPVDGPEGEADPVLDSGSGMSYPSLSIQIPESPIPNPDVAEPVCAVVAAPARPAAQPEADLGPQHELTTSANAERTAQNEPSPTTGGDRIPQNEPSPTTGGDRIPQNEPSPTLGGDRIPQNEPGPAGRIAAPGAPVRALTLVLLVVAALFAVSVASGVGATDLPRRGRADPLLWDAERSGGRRVGDRSLRRETPDRSVVGAGSGRRSGGSDRRALVNPRSRERGRHRLDAGPGTGQFSSRPWQSPGTVNREASRLAS